MSADHTWGFDGRAMVMVHDLIAKGLTLDEIIALTESMNENLLSLLVGKPVLQAALSRKEIDPSYA